MSKPKVDKNFIVQLKGKDFVTYEGLLDLAHQSGLKSIKTEIIQIPNSNNNMTCIVKAVAITENGEFHGIGDADPKSVNKHIIPHLIRMSETRAKARALRDLTNVGMTAIEEMGGDEVNKPNKSYGNKRTFGNKGTLSESQIKRLYAIAYSVDIDAKTVKEHTAKRFNKKPEELTRQEYDTVCEGYEKMK